MRPIRPAPPRRPGGRLAHRSLLVVALVAGCSGGPAGTPAPEPTAVPQLGTAPTSPVPLPPDTDARTPTPTAPVAAAPTPAAGPARTGTFDVALADEASGVAVSTRHPDLLWLLDDGPGTTAVVAVDLAGAPRGVVTMEGVVGTDTEDLAVGPCGPTDPSPCLYVGDVGDNEGGRASVAVHRFGVPDPDQGTVVVETATFTHPVDAGPTDVEALVVDDTGTPVLLTKEEGRTRLLRPGAFADGPLVELAALAVPVPDAPLLTDLVGLTVTAADRSPDGGRLLLRTYDSVVELTAPSPGADLATVGDWTVTELPAPFEPQGEAIAYLPDGRSWVTVSERTGDIHVARR